MFDEFEHASLVFFQAQALVTHRVTVITLGWDTSSEGEQPIYLA